MKIQVSKRSSPNIVVYPQSFEELTTTTTRYYYYYYSISTKIHFLSKIDFVN